MNNLNSILIEGNLVNDPQFRTTQKGTAVAVSESNFENDITLRVQQFDIGRITTNAEKVLDAAKQHIQGYSDIDKYAGHIDWAKSDRASLRKQKDFIKACARNIEQKWNEPLVQFKTIAKEIERVFDSGIEAIDGLVKDVEAREKEEKRKQIGYYFNGKDFDLVPLVRIFNDKWLNKTFKMNDIKKEIDGKINEVYSNIKILEKASPEYAPTVKALYLETLDLAAALQRLDVLKANAERLAQEKAERERREIADNVNQNQRALCKEFNEEQRSKEIDEECALALGKTEEEIRQERKEKEDKIEVWTLRFKGTRKQLFSLRQFMANAGIAYERIGE